MCGRRPRNTQAAGQFGRAASPSPASVGEELAGDSDDTSRNSHSSTAALISTDIAMSLSQLPSTAVQYVCIHSIPWYTGEGLSTLAKKGLSQQAKFFTFESMRHTTRNKYHIIIIVSPGRRATIKNYIFINHPPVPYSTYLSASEGLRSPSTSCGPWV